VPVAADLADIVADELAKSYGWPVFPISTASHAGLRELTFAMAEQVRAHRAAQPAPEPTRIVLRPQAVDDAGFTVESDPELPGGFIVRGTRPERWIRQTAFDNDEAVGYLADRLARAGVEDALAAAGAEPGCPVTIGDVTFDWEPSTPSGVAVMMSGRGTDRRLEQNSRVSASERKAAKADRRRHRTDEELWSEQDE
jgi:GTPase